jgi:hypothetical protein
MRRLPQYLRNLYFLRGLITLRLGLGILPIMIIAPLLGIQPPAVRGASMLENGQTGSTNAIYLPMIMKPATTLKGLVTQKTVTLPHPLEGGVDSWCTWGWCTISPRLYHEPLNDSGTLVGWTDASGDGHISVLGANGSLEQTFDFPGLSLHGLAVHADGKFAVLLWNPITSAMWLSKRNANGSLIWETNIKGPLTVFNPNIGDGRLTYGNGTYAAYFAVHGVSGWVQGHEGDQLTYVNDSGVIQAGGWEWGCSHSMAELVSFHPSLNQFMPVCASDCYASKAILINDNKVVYPCDGNCGGLVAAQLGQAALGGNTWKLVFNGLNRPGFVGKGIGLATKQHHLADEHDR